MGYSVSVLHKTVEKERGKNELRTKENKPRGNEIVDGNTAVVPRREYSSCKIYEDHDNKSINSD